MRSGLWRPNPAFSHPRASGAAGIAQAGVCGDAACVCRVGRPDRDADQTPPVAARRGGSRFQPFARKTLALIHLDPAGPRADRGCCFASFRPAGTVPARQNSPPSAGRNSVSPGHPLERKVSGLSHGVGWWGKCGRIFLGWMRVEKGNFGREADFCCVASQCRLYERFWNSSDVAKTILFATRQRGHISIFLAK